MGALPVVLIVLLGCTTIRPADLGDLGSLESASFSHALFDQVLRSFVDDHGQVDYAALIARPDDLERYYLLLSKYSPDSHPELFPTSPSRLAYWINGYNAATIKAVLTYYPISSVTDVSAPALLFFMPDRSGFFFFQRLLFGGDTSSLYGLENSIIRQRFKDPRIHFALNCASGGCPRLPRRAFTADDLDAELDRETRRFIAEERNVHVDVAERKVFLSAIFDWYEEDFTGWYEKKLPQREATLLNYVIEYMPPDKVALLEVDAESFAVEFVPYDWRLNDRRKP